jgi:hypothetical protein
VGAVGDGDFDVRRKRGLREGDGCITVVWLEVTAFVGNARLGNGVDRLVWMWLDL